MTQATELRELASLAHVDGANARVGISSTAFTPVKDFEIRYSNSDTSESTGNNISGGGVGAGILIHNTDTNSGSYANIDFRSSTADARIAYKNNGNTNEGDFHFITDNTGSPESQLIIKNNGNVGIGRDPDYNLDVSGGGRFTVDLRLGSENLRLSTDGSGEFGLGYGSTHSTENRIRVYQNTTPVFTVKDDGAIYIAQVRHSVAPTLNLDFANSKQLDSRIRFYRDSIATYYDSKGILKYANTNEPRFDHDPDTGESKGLLIEEDRTNIITSSTNMLSSIWGTSATYTSIIPNSVLSPSGKYDSASIIETTDNNSHRHLTDPPISTLSGTTATYSAFVKPIGPNTRHIYFMAQNGANGFYAHFNMSNGTVHQDITGNGTGTGTDAGIVSVGNGWYRIWITGSISSSSIYHQLYFETTTRNGFTPDSYTGDGQSGFAVWGYQVEAGTFPTSYIPSDTRFTSRSTAATYYDATGVLRRAAINSPRYGYKYDGRKWVETGLILENASTNLFPQYTTTNRYRTTIVNNTSEVKSPDGGNSAMKLTPTDATAFNYTVFSIGNNSLNGSKMCGSIYAKAGTNRYLWMSVSNTNGTPSGEPNCTFDLQTGTVVRAGDIDIAEIEPVADGWYRCSVGHNIDGNGSSNQFVISVSDSTGARSSADYLYLAFPQIESDITVPTSYIYWDESGTTTRSADVASSVAYTRENEIARMDDISWYNPKESTIYGEGTSITGDGNVGSSPCLWGITDGTSTNRYLLRRNATGGSTSLNRSGYTFRVCTPGFNTYHNNDYFPLYSVLPLWQDTEIHKMALSIKPNSQIAAADGIDAEMTSITMPEMDGVTMVEIGFAGSSTIWNGHIRKLSYYPEQLSLTELIALTENN